METASVRNIVREHLESDRIAWGVNVRFVRSIEVVRLMAHAGYQWLFLDLEHSPMSLETVNQFCIAALDANIGTMVRVPHGQYGLATRALDNGAMGVVMPNVESAEQAAELVRHVKYAPFGKRGISSMVPFFHYETMSAHDLARTLNASQLTVVMIESAKGVEQAAAIAAVPGVDVLFVGASDLSFAIGAPNTGDPAVQSAIETVAAACKTHNKWLGLGGMRDAAAVARYARLGARFLLGGSDIGMLAQGARTQLAGLKDQLGKDLPPS
jgi:4-hydroxy-2-oxoheptanedioate aldolase